YDCMDELSAFKGAPAMLKDREAELMRRAALVLTGGQTLYEAKRDQHANIHPFPSSVDATHFGEARRIAGDPADQASIPHPRFDAFLRQTSWDGTWSRIQLLVDDALTRGMADHSAVADSATAS